ncbi:MAG: methionine biosynthesis protein MetW [Caulobacteraceae bacterium]
MMAQLELVHPAPLDLTRAERRGDHEVIAQMIEDGARVLDVGCGDGALMQLLARECGARVRGLEIDPHKAHRCVVRGLSVVQGDAERDLSEFPSAAFDYVVFSRTLQELRRPEAALKQAARIGDHVIVSISNAGRWSARAQLLLKGRLERTEQLHRYTARDFAELAREMRLTVDRAVPLSRGHAGAPFAKTIWRANWFCEEAVFLLTP